MKKETIIRFWKLVYSNSKEYPFCNNYFKYQKDICCKEKNNYWEAKRIFWRFYWVYKLT